MKQSPYRRLCLVALEDRCNPSGTVTGSLANGTWVLTGDANPNDIVINPTPVPGDFVLTGNDTTVAGVTQPSGVRNIVVRLFGGADSVVINNTGNHRILTGSLTFDGGTEANSVTISNMTVGKNVRVTNGTNAAGTDLFRMTNSIVQGSVWIRNGDGNTLTQIDRTNAGLSSVNKGVSVTNGAGLDQYFLRDTHVGGNVSADHGQPDAANNGGRTQIHNLLNSTARSVILGNVRVQYNSGFIATGGIWDTEVAGNVSFHFGSANSELWFDGFSVAQPVIIHGNLNISSRSADSFHVKIGTTKAKTGLIVGKNLSIVTGSGNDTLMMDRLTVAGATQITTGAGADTITIDDSTFGRLQLLTGAGDDTVNIETTAGSSFATQFRGNVLIDLGDNNDTVTLGAAGVLSQRVLFHGKSRLLGGNGNNTLNQLNLESVLDVSVQGF